MTISWKSYQRSKYLCNMLIRTNTSQVPGNENSQNKFESSSSLYPEHIATTLFQKVFLSVGSSVMALYDPYRDDMVAVLGETTGQKALKYMYAKMKTDVVGQEILRDKPHINSSTVDLMYLKSLSEETFGHTYWKFLHDNNVTPDSRQPVHFVDDLELAYVMQRYREVHDLLHTLLDMPTNMLGEVAIKWVEALQTQLPMCIGGAIFGPVRFKPGQRKRYVNTYLPWAIECGKNAKFLLNVYYEKHWETPVQDLRNELSILPAPTTTERN